MNGHEVSSSFWNEEGLIPPVKDPIGRDRSPYRMPLSDFVEEFGVSRLRRDLLSDLLDLRAALHEARLVKGFQWINGSFAEHVEVRRNRAPDDIDVVTFYHIRTTMMGSKPCTTPIRRCLRPNGALLALFIRIFSI